MIFIVIIVIIIVVIVSSSFIMINTSFHQYQIQITSNISSTHSFVHFSGSNRVSHDDVLKTYGGSHIPQVCMMMTMIRMTMMKLLMTLLMLRIPFWCSSSMLRFETTKCRISIGSSSLMLHPIHFDHFSAICCSTACNFRRTLETFTAMRVDSSSKMTCSHCQSCVFNGVMQYWLCCLLYDSRHGLVVIVSECVCVFVCVCVCVCVLTFVNAFSCMCRERNDGNVSIDIDWDISFHFSPHICSA